MKKHITHNLPLAGLLAAAMFLVGPKAGATIIGPYTPDANTLHLWHLDDSAAPAIDAVSSGGMNLAGLLNGATLGNASYSGFGTALNTASTGPGQNWALAASATGGNVTITVADTTTGAFTFEAIVFIGFDPNATISNPSEILSGESGVNANRIFQWRIVPKTATTPVRLTFENVRAISGNQPTIYAPIPTSGPDAIVMNNWYHVAVSYNGIPNTANNIKFYWTLLDPSRTAANQITIDSPTTTLSGLNPLATITTPFMVGNLGRNVNGNFVGMIDEVRISKVERTATQMMFMSPVLAWVNQPQGQFAAVGDTVTLNSLAGGLDPHYQWQFYSTNIPDATNATLVLTNVTLSDAGPYRVIATNSTSSTNSEVAMLTVGGTFDETFNTGLSPSGTLLSGGEVDPHWQLVQSDDPAYPGPAAVVVGSPPGSYLANGPHSMWLAPVSTGNAVSGNFTYRTTFLLDTVDAAHAQLTGGWGMDNAGVDILLNGVSQGLTAAGFSSLTSFTITNGFVPGVNTLDCIITNFPSSGGPNPTGLRVELRGVGVFLSNVAPYVVTFPVNVTTQSQQTATFQVAAAGSGPLSYQWYKGAAELTGQTARTLVLSDLTTADAGTYSVTVANSLGSTNASATLTVITPPALAWLGIDPTSPSYWDTTTVNWLNTASTANVAFAPYDDVLFDSRGAGTPMVDLIEQVSPNSVVVDAASDYSFVSYATGAGGIGGAASLTKKNTGTLILDTTNSYSGRTIIEAGTLQVGNGDAMGTLGAGTVSNNATLAFNRFDSFTVPNAISGSGSVTMTGSGTVGLTGNNSYTGPTVVSSGTIYVRNNTALGDTSSGTTVANGAQLRVYADVKYVAEPLTLSGFGFPTPLEGALHIDGGGAGNIWDGPITLAADAGIKVDASGTLNLTNAAGITGTDASLAVQADSTGVRGTVAGPITLGAGSFTQYGAGTWALLGTNNSWTGTTTINSPAVLQIGDGGTNGSISGSSIDDEGTLTFFSANNLVITTPISGGGVVNQNGSGMVTFPTANWYSGNTTIRGSGVLRILDGGALGYGQLTIGGAQTDTCRLELLGGITGTQPDCDLPAGVLSGAPA